MRYTFCMRNVILASLILGSGCAAQVDLTDVTAEYEAEALVVRHAVETRGFAVSADFDTVVVLRGEVSDLCHGAAACHDPETNTIYLPQTMTAVRIAGTDRTRTPSLQETVIHELVHAALDPMPTADHPEAFQLTMELAMLEVR